MLFTVLSYTGFQTYQTQLANSQFKEYSRSPQRQWDKPIAYIVHDNPCKI